MTTFDAKRSAVAIDVLVERSAEGACCDARKQESCCEPSQKPSCCGPSREADARACGCQ